jgi:uncharacterized protein (TIGR00369 family)
MTRREQAARAKRVSDVMTIDPRIDQRIRSSFARMQAMATFGASLHAVRKGEVEIVLPFSSALAQQHGFTHAGVLATIADTACGYAALTLMPSDAAVLTTEFKINLLSPAQGERFMAVGRVVRPGRNLMVCLGEVFAEQGDARKQVALMTASMMVVDGATGLRD